MEGHGCVGEEAPVKGFGSAQCSCPSEMNIRLWVGIGGKDTAEMLVVWTIGKK